jgi:hypothetical protein
VFFDEATSSLDEATEGELYQALLRICPEVTIVSIGTVDSDSSFVPSLPLRSQPDALETPHPLVGDPNRWVLHTATHHP